MTQQQTSEPEWGYYDGDKWVSLKEKEEARVKHEAFLDTYRAKGMTQEMIEKAEKEWLMASMAKHYLDEGDIKEEQIKGKGIEIPEDGKITEKFYLDKVARENGLTPPDLPKNDNQSEGSSQGNQNNSGAKALDNTDKEASETAQTTDTEKTSPFENLQTHLRLFAEVLSSIFKSLAEGKPVDWNLLNTPLSELAKKEKQQQQTTKETVQPSTEAPVPAPNPNLVEAPSNGQETTPPAPQPESPQQPEQQVQPAVQTR